MSSVLKAMTTNDTFTKNGAIASSSTGNALLNYFAQCSTYRGRSQDQVNLDMISIFNENPWLAMKTVMYNRLITRKPNGYDSVQRGQGQKDEFIKSIKWLEENRKDFLYKNLWLVPVVGSWKDLWYDSANTGVYHYVNVKEVAQLVAHGIKDEKQCGLIAKYLPKIRSASNTKNDRHRRLNSFARSLCTELGISEKEYRKFKSNPNNTAHSFQRLMCSNKWDKINFNQIPGKALLNLVKGKSLASHNLETKYEKWIDKQPVAKFNGYVYELAKEVFGGSRCTSMKSLTKVKAKTINKQFEGLLETATKDVAPELLDKGVLCALDTSASMTWSEVSPGVTPYNVCLSLGVYFASLMKGHFKDHAIAFNNTSRLFKIAGSNFVEKLTSAANCGGWGGTNFQSVIDELVRVRQTNPNIPLEEYPEVLLVCSDMQFNPTGSNESNYQTAMRKLKAVGLNEMTIIWWHLNGDYGRGNFPSTLDDKGTIQISGFDGAIITKLLGGIEKAKAENQKVDPYQMMVDSLDQDVLNQVQV